jgi:hypothetical protein
MYPLNVRKSSSSDIRLGLARPFLRANCLVIWHVLIFLGWGAFDAVSVSEKNNQFIWLTSLSPSRKMVDNTSQKHSMPGT